jgi:Flp pilus assembly CpaF family ATPase
MRNGDRQEREPIVNSDHELVDLIRRIASRMGHREQRFDPAHPELNLQLPDGSRLFAAMEVSSHPTLIIRRHKFEFSNLSELVTRNMLSVDVARFLSAAVRAKKNIVIAGGTGSGKTTLLRALLNEIPHNERIVTIEDAFELGIEHFEANHPDHDALQARAANIEGQGEITMSDLTRMALRMDPDRVIVGEVRGAEAFPMLMAMSQGNNGSMCTLHADSARSVFPKLLAYVSMAAMGLPTETVNALVASAIHFVVHIQNLDGRRCVTSIIEVTNAEGSSIISNEVFTHRHPESSFLALRTQTSEVLGEYGFHRRTGMSWSA